ncbi:MAG: hypothetical protein ACI84C_000547 [Flavobacteriales bacterium]|jgi:hypothetical protein
MKKDIDPPIMENVAVAVAKEKDNLMNDIWNVYLFNLNDVKIEGVIVRSNGYGELDGKKVKTSELRHMFEEVSPLDSVLVEPFMDEMRAVTNQFWVSCWIDGVLKDKKYIFVVGSIDERYMVPLPWMDDVKGVIIR